MIIFTSVDSKSKLSELLSASTLPLSTDKLIPALCRQPRRENGLAVRGRFSRRLSAFFKGVFPLLSLRENIYLHIELRNVNFFDLFEEWFDRFFDGALEHFVD